MVTTRGGAAARGGRGRGCCWAPGGAQETSLRSAGASAQSEHSGGRPGGVVPGPGQGLWPEEERLGDDPAVAPAGQQARARALQKF